MITPKSINQFRQNKPTLIVEDLMVAGDTTDPEFRKAQDKHRDSMYEILLSRGVFKWFSVRRKLIKLKNRWKDRVNTTQDYQTIAKYTGRWNRVWYWRGYRKALEECRAEVRALCHSPRWQCQDNDPIAARWLYENEDKLKKEVLASVLPDCESPTPEIPQDPLSNLGGVG